MLHLETTNLEHVVQIVEETLHLVCRAQLHLSSCPDTCYAQQQEQFHLDTASKQRLASPFKFEQTGREHIRKHYGKSNVGWLVGISYGSCDGLGDLTNRPGILPICRHTEKLASFAIQQEDLVVVEVLLQNPVIRRGRCNEARLG